VEIPAEEFVSKVTVARRFGWKPGIDELRRLVVSSTRLVGTVKKNGRQSDFDWQSLKKTNQL